MFIFVSYSATCVVVVFQQFEPEQIKREIKRNIISLAMINCPSKIWSLNQCTVSQ